MKIHILGASNKGRRKTLCGKKRGEVWPDKCYDPDRNVKTVINQLRKAGKQAEVCIYCTKWADIAIINEIDLWMNPESV